MFDQIVKNSTSNIATIRVLNLDEGGTPWTGLVSNADGLEIYYTPKGGTPVQINLSGNWTEKVHGYYEVVVPDAAYQQNNAVTISGVITNGIIIPALHKVVDYPPVGLGEEINKIPKAGQTHRYTNTDTSAAADVAISNP